MAIKSFERLTSTALALPERQRARLIRALWNSMDSLGGNSPVDPVVLETLKKRDREISQGKVRCKTHAEVMKTARKAIGCPG